ncbi:Flp pilus assembly protein, pilin Flp [Erythrobacter litoralis]|jgi:pilus assembly protein Flp/PilA|uniref:Flp family type IVb pilin n=1 Tax=Erythrobacter litoralis TaxID=39960 RepID=UPI00054EAACE|nr:Flp family type IVb pilin [Erythrobacter litoralis]AOL23749.1 Flp pilus assembly protein, pilin Flp [Erythrobacter litoralis]
MILAKFLKHIGNDKSGATAVEYGLIVSLIVIAAVGSFQAVADENDNMWQRVQDASNEAVGN